MWTGAGGGLLIAALIWGALRVPAPAPAPELQTALARVDAASVADHLGEAIRIRTVSRSGESHWNTEEFLELHAWLARTYPAAHAALLREIVNGESLLFEWRGRDPSLSPMAFLAHMDVVPVQSGTEASWTHPPFSGRIANGFVWGRGAIDMKGTLVAVMEAVEYLAAEGFVPERTVYLAFGHDEEVGGRAGAARNAATLAERGVQLAWTMDEGGFVVENAIPGLDIPLASVSVAEKGYVTLEITAHAEGGHSSVPSRETAVGRLAKAILVLQDNPFPARIDGIVGEMMDRIAGASSFAVRLVLGNRWLFGPLIRAAADRQSAMGAMMRTTTAPTMLEASPQENVLAQEAKATVNFRIYPGDTMDSVLARVRDLVANENVQVALEDPDSGSNPSPISATDNDAFVRIERSIRGVYPTALVVPGLLLAGTDSRHYEAVADDTYRFAPVWITPNDASRIHGTNERVAVDALARMVQYYVHFFRTELGAAP